MYVNENKMQVGRLAAVAMASSPRYSLRLPTPTAAFAFFWAPWALSSQPANNETKEMRKTLSKSLQNKKEATARAPLQGATGGCTRATQVYFYKKFF
jgi:hypothetical protein